MIVREAGKSYANAVAEVREAVDFLRYYAGEAVRLLGPGAPAPLGPSSASVPWNFPLAIFTGQIAAALAAGNVVLAKPAEETPLIAAEGVRLLHEAGVPADALQLLPGAGEVGAALVGDARAQGVMFTGSTPVAGLIARQLAGRLTRAGQPIPLIAETGGLNAMIVDSSALAEQVVGDVVSSAFDSAGQRCSALRILCLQEDVADRMLAMLKGAMAELEVGDPRAALDRRRSGHHRRGATTTSSAMSRRCGRAASGSRKRRSGRTPARGTFVAPTLIEVDRVADVEREVFGPVLHVLRYRRARSRSARSTRSTPPATGSPSACTRASTRRSRASSSGSRPAISTSTATSSARRSACSRSAARVSPAPGRRRADRSISAALSPSRRRTRWTAWRARRPRSPTCARSSIGCARRARTPKPSAASGLASRSPLGARVELAGPVGERNVYALRRRGLIAALRRER